MLGMACYQETVRKVVDAALAAASRGMKLTSANLWFHGSFCRKIHLPMTRTSAKDADFHGAPCLRAVNIRAPQCNPRIK